MDWAKRLKCFLRWHEWQQAAVFARGGFGVGLRCKHCGLWHKTKSIRRPYPNESQDISHLFN
jgi:hypothetical protein